MSKHKNLPAEVENKAIVTAEDASAWEQYAGSGTQNISKDDFTLPWLKLIQPGSAAVLDKIADSRPGNLINTATDELFTEELDFVPCYLDKYLVEWKPNRKGFVGLHEWEGELHRKLKQEQGYPKKIDPSNPESNDVSETHYVYGLLLKDPNDFSFFDRIAIAFSGSKVRPYKSMMNKLRGVQIKLSDGRVMMLDHPNPKLRIPLFAHRLKLSTVKESNDKGTWWNFNIAWDGDANKSRLDPKGELMKMADEFSKSLQEKVYKVDFSTGEAGDEGITPSEDSEIPFA